MNDINKYICFTFQVSNYLPKILPKSSFVLFATLSFLYVCDFVDQQGSETPNLSSLSSLKLVTRKENGNEQVLSIPLNFETRSSAAIIKLYRHAFYDRKIKICICIKKK